MTLIEFFIIAASFVASFVGVGLYRQWSIRKGILAVPNERSSHVQPTPSGGGLVIALAAMAAYVAITRNAGGEILWGYIAGSLIIVAISWLDDAYSVSFIWRFLCHVVAAVMLVSGLVYLGPGALSGYGTSVQVIAVVITVCVITAYNFMDGIDGMAGLQAVVIGVAWWVFAPPAGGLASFCLSIAAVSLGFLLHNWQPARIFMGDAGSAFLGYSFSAVPMLAAAADPGNDIWYAYVGVLALCLFGFDTFVTGTNRVLRGKRLWHGHREHFYQKLMLSGLKHSTVSLLYAALTSTIMFITYLVSPLNRGYRYLPAFVASAAGIALWAISSKKNLLT